LTQTTSQPDKMSPRRVVGFACNQGFIFFLFYMGQNRALTVGAFTFERADLIGALLFMVLALLVLRLLSESSRRIVFSRPALVLYALMLMTGSLLTQFLPDQALPWWLLESFLVGVSYAFLLASWGHSFGEAPTKVSAPEVFFASFIGALFGITLSIIPLPSIELVFCLLPLASAAALLVPSQYSTKNSFLDLATPPSTATKNAASNTKPIVVDEKDASKQTALLTLKIMAGTALFGMAAGFMETFNTQPGTETMPAFGVALLLFAAFALGTLSLLLSDGFGKGAALNKGYRLAIFVMLLGFLLLPSPLFVDSATKGEAIILAGYLGLSAVLISLFLVLAEITNTSTTVSFSKGFAALFGGEVVGIFLANILSTAQPGETNPYSVVVFAGIIVLFSYLFLFTERDFSNLSEIVTSADSFESTCQEFIARYSLSAREAEVLPFVLKGRTSDRISRELFISKSTVETHLSHIYTKAGVHNRQELIDLSDLLSS